MKTQIFKDYSEFYQRGNKEINGVTAEFAEENPEYEKENETNKGCWNCSDCYGCSDCSGCSGCSGCSRCYGCSDCYGCYGCSGCSGLKNNAPDVMLEIPIIENIHHKILEATSQPNTLNMDTWHTCETTHCRAGWVVQLAGEAGKKLESRTTTLFAAMQIHNKSSEIKVSPPRFYETNEIAMSDIKRCAELESLNK